MTEEPLERWEGGTAAELAAEWGAPAVHLYRTVGSTNDLARRLAAGGAAEGTVVLAEEQRAGRGRAGRGWVSPAELGLWLSIVARPAAVPEPGLLPILVGLHVATALDKFLPDHSTQVKWPNDLVLLGRKLGGILCEATWEGNRPGAFVVGVGINVLHDPADFPEEVRDSAISLGMAAGAKPPRRAVAASLVAALIRRLARPVAMQPGELDALASRDLLRGRAVVVTEPVSGATLAQGWAEGIAADGSLLLRETDTGFARAVHSGTVRLRQD